MNEIYWIQRLDFINVLIGTILILSIVAIIALIIVSILIQVDAYDEDDRLKAKSFWKATIITSIVTMMVSVGYGFIPTKQDMYEIYAIGGTIEYVRNSDEVKQLPEKTVKALNMWLDEYTKDKETE